MTCSTISTMAAPRWMVVRRWRGMTWPTWAGTVGRSGQVGPDEDDAGAGLGGPEPELDVAAARGS